MSKDVLVGCTMMIQRGMSMNGMIARKLSSHPTTSEMYLDQVDKDTNAAP